MNRTLFSLSLLAIAHTGNSTVWTIGNSGNTYVPNLVTITLGDTVRFQITSSHDAREVSSTTYNMNGNTALPGGFQTPFGGGFVYPPQLGVGTHYFVCTPHAAQGMKGRIIVQDLGTDIAEGSLEAPVRVFPVPAIDLVVIEGAALSPGQPWQLMHADGTLVRTGTTSGTLTTVNVAGFTPGLYLLQVGDDRRQLFRIVKQ